MARGAFTGSTDFSTQPLSEVVKELSNWKKDIKGVSDLFEETIREIDTGSLSVEVDIDFLISCRNLYSFFITAIQDLKDVLDGIDSEIQEYHVNLLKNIGQNAGRFYRSHRKVWHASEYKPYWKNDFRPVEKLYVEGSDMTGDMIDINNAAERLKDFVGKRSQNNTPSPYMQQYNTFNAPITNLQQNNHSSNVQQNVNSAGIGELQQLLISVRDIIPHLTEPKDKNDINEQVEDLEETLQEENPKQSRIKAALNTINGTLSKAFNMRTFNNVDQVSKELPSIIENTQDILDKF
ncbi:hypothetical protein [Pontibacillus salipaludis]|uniref:Uncharacterized protein n=1 Tax=Pontibacillus salipaludis TaxID=1697394 RepID=A0ABQ1PRX5_9BACI|nr:hypothetical protein [Pontibacillus salipaludis]GGD02266.1 hypothetical protein GCM10011389_07110 [Pontibacillus salipaludis]